MTFSHRSSSDCRRHRHGLFFGEQAAALKWRPTVSSGCQMMVLPHHRLDRRQLGSLGCTEVHAGFARRGGHRRSLARRAFVRLPDPADVSSVQTPVLQLEPRRAPAIRLRRSLRSSNPFTLANNVVPAVVLFSIVLGVALIGVEHKGEKPRRSAGRGGAISRATRLVTRLTPMTVAIAANAAGTLSVEQLSRLQVYLVATSRWRRC